MRRCLNPMAVSCIYVYILYVHTHDVCARALFLFLSADARSVSCSLFLCVCGCLYIYVCVYQASLFTDLAIYMQKSVLTEVLCNRTLLTFIYERDMYTIPRSLLTRVCTHAQSRALFTGSQLAAVPTALPPPSNDEALVSPEVVCGISESGSGGEGGNEAGKSQEKETWWECDYW